MIDFHPSELESRDNERLGCYRRYLDFYNGKQWPSPTRARERHLVFNYAKVFIDKATSHLMHGLSFPCYPVEESDELKGKVNQVESLLREVYEQNSLQQLDWETEIDTAILGDGCYKVFWDVNQRCIRVTSPDPSGIFAWWMGDDLSRVWRVASRYFLSREEARVLYGVKTDRGRVKITEVWTEKLFDLWMDEELIESKRNPYGFIPFIIFPNLRQPKQFWGISDIPQVMEPQRELNRAISQLSRILEVSGNPIAVLENVPAEKDIKVEPGAVWTLPEDAKAYLLDLLQGGGIRLHIDYIDIIYRCLHDISETPRAAFGGVEKDLSGTALSIELGALVQKVTRKRTTRTAANHRRTELILKLAEKFMEQGFRGVLHGVVWGPILPADMQRQSQSEQLLVQWGIHSRRTAMDEVGVQNPDVEFGRWLEERAKIRQQDIDLPLS